MNSSRVSKVFLGVAIVLALMPLFYAGVTRDPDEASAPGEGFLIWIGLISTATTMVLSGLFISGGRWPIAGGVLVVLGAILMGISFLWLAPMWGVALIIAVIGIVRAWTSHARRLPS